MSNALNWFEIPAADLNRATSYYETLLGKPLRRESSCGMPMSIFPYDEKAGVGGCVVAGEGCVPGSAGTVVYLDASPSIDAVLARNAAAGGEIAVTKTALPEGMGYFAQLIDTEGNRVGIHSLT